jgi:o-succinylbenzoate synthase
VRLEGPVRRIHVRRYVLRFVAPVRTATSTFTHRTGWHVGVETPDGRIGWGDAAPWPGFGNDAAAASEALARAEGVWDDERAFFERVAGVIEAEAAFSLAACDLMAQATGVPLRDLAGRTRGAETVPVHALVNSPAEAEAAVARGYRTVKVKVGAAPVEADVARLLGIRAAVGGQVAIRLDANAAWDEETAIAAVSRLAVVSPAHIEQPTRDMAACARVGAATGVAIALDESLGSEADVHRALVMGAMEVAVIKPAFFRSWMSALAAALQCQRAGVGVVVTCALESAIGRWGALHLAAALGEGVEAAGLEAPLAEDAAEFPVAVDGRLRPTWVTGLGVAPR